MKGGAQVQAATALLSGVGRATYQVGSQRCRADESKVHSKPMLSLSGAAQTQLSCGSR